MVQKYRFTAKVKSELPQKSKTNYHKSQKQNAAKSQKNGLAKMCNYLDVRIIFINFATE